MVIKEFLVALGLQDNMTEKLEKTTKDGGQKAEKFVAKLAKNFAAAGMSVAGFVSKTATGFAEFIGGLATAEDEVSGFSRNLEASKEEAYKVKSALDVMGKSMEEIALNPELMKQFEALKENAEMLQLPDNMTESFEKTTKDIGQKTEKLAAKLEKTTKDIGQKAEKFVAKLAKNFAIAGMAVAGFVATITSGFAKFMGGLAKADDELNVFARNLGLPKEEAEKGGVLEKGQTGFLEGKGAEAVVPLEKNTGWIKKVADQFTVQLSSEKNKEYDTLIKKFAEKLNGTMERFMSVIAKLADNIGKTLTAIASKTGNGAASELFLEKYKAALQITQTLFANNITEIGQKMKEFLDNANRVMTQMAQISNVSYSTMNSRISYDNRTYDQKSTFHINDMSGEPRTVAEMVDKTQSLRIRNMRGVFA